MTQTALRVLFVGVPALIFAWFAYQDARFHASGRKIPRLEQALHAGLGLAELALIGGAFAGAELWMAGGALATAALGACDEYIFHLDIPTREASLHAKGHLALFMLLVAGLCVPLLWPHAR